MGGRHLWQESQVTCTSYTVRCSADRQYRGWVAPAEFTPALSPAKRLAAIRRKIEPVFLVLFSPFFAQHVSISVVGLDVPTTSEFYHSDLSNLR